MTDPTTHIFLSHGLESGPGSTKIQAMKAEAERFENVRAHAIDHRSTKDPATRLAQMREAMASVGAAPERTVLAGSSMGGWVCAQTSSETPVLGCFLLAMALGGNKSPRVLVAWCVSGAASLAAWKWLPPNMHVVVGAIAGGLVGLFWLEHKTAVADNQREVSDDH